MKIKQVLLPFNAFFLVFSIGNFLILRDTIEALEIALSIPSPIMVASLGSHWPLRIYLGSVLILTVLGIILSLWSLRGQKTTLEKLVVGGTLFGYIALLGLPLSWSYLPILVMLIVTVVSIMQPCDTMIFGLSCLTRHPKTAVPTYVWERLFLPCMLEAEGQAIQDANQQVTSAEIVEFILALVMLSSLDQERG